MDRQAEREKRQAAASSVIAAVGLTALKLAVGLLTGSLGILAEAAHSGLDLIAALVTFFAVRISDRPPDEQYRYGYGKVENLSALIETLLLLITCAWIIYEAVQRLFFKSVPVEASIWAFLVMAVSVATDVTRSRILYRAARKHHSQALEADALHFSTDIWSSSVVIVGLGLVWLGEHLAPKWSWLVHADAVAALIVALFVIYVSAQLGRRAISVLLDEAPPGLAERIGVEARKVPGVEGLGPLRLRQAGAMIFVDLVVDVDRSLALEEAHEVAEAVDRRVRGVGEDLSQTVSAVAAHFGLRTHFVHAHEVRGRLFVDLHVEVPADQTVGQAHDRVTRMEAAVREELPQVRDIHSHIEPLATVVEAVTPLAGTEDQHLRAQILQEARQVAGLKGCNEIHIRPGPYGYDVVMNCYVDPEMPVAQAHRLSDELEKRVQARIPGIQRVLVHMAPKGEDAAKAG
jgi:cation diffusion facilitator family transporter